MTRRGTKVILITENWQTSFANISHTIALLTFSFPRASVLISDRRYFRVGKAIFQIAIKSASTNLLAAMIFLQIEVIFVLTCGGLRQKLL